MLNEMVLSVLLSLPRFGHDTETAEQRHERLAMIANAIEEASERATCGAGFATSTCKPLWPGSAKSLAMMLVTQGFMESRFAQRVHEGRCKVQIGECDGGRARSVWQVQATGIVPRSVWATIGEATPESTRMAAWAATVVLARARSGCGSLSGAVSRYATGKTCQWKGAARRLAFYERLMARS